MNPKPDAPTRVETSPPREGLSQDKEMEDILSEIVLDQGEDNELWRSSKQITRGPLWPAKQH